MNYEIGKKEKKQLISGLLSIVFIFVVWKSSNQAVEEENQILRKGNSAIGTLIDKGAKGKGTYEYYILGEKYLIVDIFISMNKLELGEKYTIKYLDSNPSNGIVDFRHPIFEANGYIEKSSLNLKYMRKDKSEDYGLFEFTYQVNGVTYNRFQYVTYKKAKDYEFKSKVVLLINKTNPQIAYLK